MKNKALIFSIFISLNAMALRIPPSFNQVGAGLTIGCSQLNISPILAFVPKHAGTFKNNQLLIGGYGFTSSNKWILGVSGTLALGDKVNTDSFSYTMSGAYGTVDLAYLLVNKTKFKVYPMLGIGSSAYGLGISRKKDLSKEQVNSNQKRDIHINNGGIILDISCNLNTIPVLKFNKLKNKNNGLTAGLKLGYVYGIKNSSWHYTGGIVTDGPTYGMRMLYLKLTLGGFSY